MTSEPLTVEELERPCLHRLLFTGAKGLFCYECRQYVTVEIDELWKYSAGIVAFKESA